MNKEKPYIYKRIIGYVIDLFIIAIITGLLTVFITKEDNSNKIYDELVNLTEKFSSGELTQDEYLKEYENLNYELTKDSVDVTLITCAISLVYYVIFAYYADGQTIGKKIMKIKVVSANGKKLTFNNYLIRSLIIDSILVNIITSALVIFLSRDIFIKSYTIISDISTFILVGSLLFVLYRNDGRGLHDLIANTKIVHAKKDILEANYEEVSEENPYPELSNTVQVSNEEVKEGSKEEQEDQFKKKSKSKKKNKKIEVNAKGVKENERI